jgi:hypothetical protein
MRSERYLRSSRSGALSAILKYKIPNIAGIIIAVTSLLSWLEGSLQKFLKALSHRGLNW